MELETEERFDPEAFIDLLRGKYPKRAGWRAKCQWAINQVATLVRKERIDSLLKGEAKLRFLAILAVVEREVQQGHKSDKFRRYLRDAVIEHFGLDRKKFAKQKPREVIYHLIKQSVKAFPSDSRPVFVDMSGVKPMSYKKGFKAAKTKALFRFSRRINRNKPDRNKITSHIWLGKIPTVDHVAEPKSNATSMFAEGDCQPDLVVSAVAEQEFLSDTKDIAAPAHFLMRGVAQTCLSGFIDFGRPYRDNPAWDKAKHPRTGEKFESKEKWNTFLDGLYEDIYHAHCLMEEAIDDDLTVYVHCKAGKGRSVMVVASYLVTHPEYLLQEIDASSDSVKVPKKLRRRIEKGTLTNEKGIRALTEIVWAHMVQQRSHIDKDEASKQAVMDCVQFIYANEKRLQMDAKDSDVKENSDSGSDYFAISLSLSAPEDSGSEDSSEDESDGESLSELDEARKLEESGYESDQSDESLSAKNSTYSRELIR